MNYSFTNGMSNYLEGVHPLPRASQEIAELDLFLDLALGGFAVAQTEPEAVQQHEEVNRVLKRPPTSPEILERKIKVAKKRAEFAANKSEEGYTYLFGICIVRLWTILEAAIDDTALMEAGEIRPGHNAEMLRSLKGPLIEFIEATKENQGTYLLGALKENVKANLKPGLAKFEAILEPFGLGGAVDPDVRRTLLEFSAVRNLIVHRNGKVDKQFLSTCPWLSINIGNKLVLTGELYHKYVSASMWYLLEVDYRLQVRECGSGSQANKNWQADLMHGVLSTVQPISVLDWKSMKSSPKDAEPAHS